MRAEPLGLHAERRREREDVRVGRLLQVGNRGGTPLRSKAYQAYGYFNLRDYGLADKKTSIDTVRLAIFVVVTTIATALLAVTIGNISFNATTKYRAVFTDVVGLNKGDDIRIAGVRVGQVDKIAIYQDWFIDKAGETCRAFMDRFDRRELERLYARSGYLGQVHRCLGRSKRGKRNGSRAQKR